MGEDFLTLGVRLVATLVEQLQADALDRNISIADLLRKTKAAAVKLKRTDLIEWIESELSGYKDKKLPPYRVLHAELKFFNPYRGWCPIVGAPPTWHCGVPIAELLSLLESTNPQGIFVVSVSAQISSILCRDLGFVADIKQHVSRASVAAIIDAVRNAILDWALNLEAVGIRGDGLSFSPVETKKARGVTINIGSIGNAVGVGSFGDNARITARQNLNAEALAASVMKLVQEAERLVPNSDLPEPVRGEALQALAELRSAASERIPDTGRIRGALDALRRVMEHVAGHVIGAGVLALIAQVHPAL
ncbi:MAG TPA: hypothetical protein VM755_14515 [Stellaceae bacterium]|nr:hypothetical protein [Stellaceae bacterium]